MAVNQQSMDHIHKLRSFSDENEGGNVIGERSVIEIKYRVKARRSKEGKQKIKI
jgi:hypothetical protein